MGRFRSRPSFTESTCLLIFDSGWAIWAYVTGKRRLVDADLDPSLIKGGRLMGLAYTLILLPAIGISFINPIVSFSIYSFIVVVFIVSTALGKGEIAMILPTASKTSPQDKVDMK